MPDEVCPKCNGKGVITNFTQGRIVVPQALPRVLGRNTAKK